MHQQSFFNNYQTQDDTSPIEHKLNSLIKTQHSQQHQSSHPLTLLTCPSSISIKTTSQGLQYQIHIFSQYLLTNSQTKKIKLQQKMISHFHSLSNLNSSPINILLPKISHHNSQLYSKLQKPLYFYHFIASWIISMGFQDKQTKKYVLSKIHNNPKSKSQQINFYQKFYQNLGYKVLNQSQRFEFLFKLCMNGWDYFIFQLIEIGKKLKRQKPQIKNV